MYIPDEITVSRKVIDHPVTRSILDQRPGVPVRMVDRNQPEDIKEASHILTGTNSLAEAIRDGNRVLAIVSTKGVIKPFDIPDPRLEDNGFQA
jgi:hypothetical protein